jgi:hypothetical protein
LAHRAGFEPKSLALDFLDEDIVHSQTSARGGRVIYRKGELGKDAIDCDWPLPAPRCTGRNYVTMHLFCEGFSLCPRGHSFRRDNIDINVFCFAKREDAELFQVRFGGEFIDPKDRPKWPG